jgi:hypothetical protein
LATRSGGFGRFLRQQVQSVQNNNQSQNNNQNQSVIINVPQQQVAPQPTTPPQGAL